MTATEHPSGWYLDPVPGAPEHQYRYWTGHTWTQHVATPGLGPRLAEMDRGGQTWKRLAVTALVLVVLLAAARYVVTRDGSSNPDQWDAQVAPIAARVSALRGLKFEHPVRVRYLTEAQFRRKVRVERADLTSDARREVRELAGTLRALGLISADTDLVKALDTANQSGVVGFYDPYREEIVVRGTGPLDIERKATLAHELTHVLQDQHFGLAEMRADAEASRTGSAGALTALTEGDAERIKRDYLHELPASEQRAYDTAEARAGTDINREMDDVAQIVKIELGAPYAFGPDVLAALTAKGGNAAVDEALRRPAPTDAIYLDPTAAMERADVVAVDAPSLDEDERRIGNPDEMGAFDLYTLLASRIDRQVALDAADTWAGDRMVTYRSEGQVCVRATIASTTRTGAETLAGALSAWAASMPAATITSDLAHSRSTLTSCDTGDNPAPDSEKLAGALLLLEGRNGLLASLLTQDIPTGVGECVSRRLVKTSLFLATIERGGDLSSTERQEARRLTSALMKECAGRVAS